MLTPAERAAGKARLARRWADDRPDTTTLRPRTVEQAPVAPPQPTMTAVQAYAEGQQEPLTVAELRAFFNQTAGADDGAAVTAGLDAEGRILTVAVVQ